MQRSLHAVLTVFREIAIAFDVLIAFVNDFSTRKRQHSHVAFAQRLNRSPGEITHCVRAASDEIVVLKEVK